MARGKSSGMSEPMAEYGRYAKGSTWTILTKDIASIEYRFRTNSTFATEMGLRQTHLTSSLNVIACS